MVDVAPERTATDLHDPLLRVHANIVHRRKVDYQSAIAHSQPARVMPAAADSHQQFLLAAELHRRYDVGHVGAAGNQSRVPIDHPVVYFASRVVTRISWLDQTSAQAGSESCNLRFVQRYPYPRAFDLLCRTCARSAVRRVAWQTRLRHLPNLAGFSIWTPGSRIVPLLLLRTQRVCHQNRSHRHWAPMPDPSGNRRGDYTRLGVSIRAPT